MRRELEIHQELKRVRKRLAHYRADGRDEEGILLFGAQQALTWMLEQGMSPSDLDAIILEAAENGAA